MLCNFAELVVREVEKKHVVRLNSILVHNILVSLSHVAYPLHAALRALFVHANMLAQTYHQ